MVDLDGRTLDGKGTQRAIGLTRRELLKRTAIAAGVCLLSPITLAGKRRNSKDISIKLNDAEFYFNYYPGGDYLMGIPKKEVVDLKRRYKIVGRTSTTFNSWPKHLEEVKPFWVLNDCITNQQYFAIFGKKNKDQSSIVNITYIEAQGFVAKFNEAYKKKYGNRLGYLTPRLPTEVEFEYLARQIKKLDYKNKTYSSPKEISKLSDGRTHRLLGHIWQWTETKWEPYGGNTFSEKKKSAYVLRGGCRVCKLDDCLPFSRWEEKEDYVDRNTGFRIVLRKR